jgi:hypothetical protein
MRTIGSFIILLLLSSIATAEVVRKVAITLPTDGQELMVNAVFATGAEARKHLAGGNVSDNKNYVIFAYQGRNEVLEIVPPVIGVTSTFTAKHFIQLFEVQGECNGVSINDRRYTFRIRARNQGPMKNEWLDPAVTGKSQDR